MNDRLGTETNVSVIHSSIPRRCHQGATKPPTFTVMQQIQIQEGWVIRRVTPKIHTTPRPFFWRSVCLNPNPSLPSIPSAAQQDNTSHSVFFNPWHKNRDVNIHIFLSLQLPTRGPFHDKKRKGSRFPRRQLPVQSAWRSPAAKNQ